MNPQNVLSDGSIITPKRANNFFTYMIFFKKIKSGGFLPGRLFPGGFCSGVLLLPVEFSWGYFNRGDFVAGGFFSGVFCRRGIFQRGYFYRGGFATGGFLPGIFLPGVFCNGGVL